MKHVLRRSAAIAAVATTLAGSRAVAEPAGLDSRTAAGVDAVVRAELARDRTPGAQIAIGRGGTLLYAKGYGLRDVATRAPVDDDTRFEIGSVTKQFTAACVMQFVQAGSVDLDSPIARYLDGIPSGEKITVRELLTHTSGLVDYVSDPLFDPSLARAPRTPRDLLKYPATRSLEFAPGTRWEYSNTNYAVLGLLVAKLSGESFGEYLHAHVIVPNHLAATALATSFLVDGDDALGYDVSGSTPKRIVGTDVSWAYAAGGLYSTASDLVRWEHALYSDRVVDAASLAAMTTPETLSASNPMHYGFGLMNTDLYGEEEIWHNGGLPGFAARVAYFPASGYEIATTGNAVTFNPDPIVRDVLALLVPSVATRIVAQAAATPAPGDEPKMHALAVSLLAQAQSGKLDHALFSEKMNAGLTPALVDEVTTQIAPLGKPKAVTFLRKRVDAQYAGYEYRLVWDTVVLDESFALDSSGKIVSWLFRPDDGATAPAASPAPPPAPSVSPA